MNGRDVRGGTKLPIGHRTGGHALGTAVGPQRGDTRQGIAGRQRVRLSDQEAQYSSSLSPLMRLRKVQ